MTAQTEVAKPLRQPVATAAVILCGAAMLGFGVWAYAAPESFASFIDYQPYNRHLVHDAGAFQIAIGCTTLLALVWTDAVRHIGGHDSDVPLLGLFTIIGLCGIAARLRGRKS
jgi:hypothetical protein